jgi:outer membrane murein-binding lipoprotein Lpp
MDKTEYKPGEVHHPESDEGDSRTSELERALADSEAADDVSISPDPEPEPTNPAAPAKKPRKVIKKLLLIVLILLLMAGPAAGVYFWQADRLNKANKSVSDLQKKVAELENKAKQAETTQPVSNEVELATENFSFKAPSDWKAGIDPPTGGKNFEDSKGNSIFIDTDPSPQSADSVDFIWVAGYSESGVTVSKKSPVCTPGQSGLTFEGTAYSCDASTNFSRVEIRGEAGQILKAGAHTYKITFTNSASGSADTTVFENILKTFKSK